MCSFDRVHLREAVALFLSLHNKGECIRNLGSRILLSTFGLLLWFATSYRTVKDSPFKYVKVEYKVM